jgi:hypothetical protein
MRAERPDDPLIGVSCGHRVPRLPVPAKVGNRYWCPTCGAHRMSGGKTTGERSMDFLFELRDDVARAGIELVFAAEPPRQTREVIEALGAAWSVSAAAG